MTSETFEFDRDERFALERALDFAVWNSCDELTAALSALNKIDGDAGRRAIDDVCGKVAALAAGAAE